MPTPEDWKWLEKLEAQIDTPMALPNSEVLQRLRAAWEREEKLEKALRESIASCGCAECQRRWHDLFGEQALSSGEKTGR